MAGGVDVTDDFPGSLPLSELLKIDMVAHKEEVEEITEGAGAARTHMHSAAGQRGQEAGMLGGGGRGV